MKSFKEFLKESIEKADLKKHPELKDWIKNWNRTRYKDLFQEYSTGNYKLDPTKTRIYFPLEKKDSNLIKQEIVDFLESKGYFVVDYLKGDVRTKKNRLTKIEVLLNSLKEPELKLKYQADIKERKLDNYSVVISRNPYDIAGMSIRRKWSAASCMNMDHPSLGKEYAVRHIPNDIVQGSLVAYLIRSEDRFIKNPLIRVTIRPYMSFDGDESKIIFGAGTKLYLSGNDNIATKNQTRFAEAVKNWIIDVHSKQELNDVFELKSGLYDREAVSVIDLKSKNKFSVLIKKYLNSLYDITSKQVTKDLRKSINTEFENFDIDTSNKKISFKFNNIKDLIYYFKYVNGVKRFVDIYNICNFDNPTNIKVFSNFKQELESYYIHALKKLIKKVGYDDLLEITKTNSVKELYEFLKEHDGIDIYDSFRAAKNKYNLEIFIKLIKESFQKLNIDIEVFRRIPKEIEDLGEVSIEIDTLVFFEYISKLEKIDNETFNNLSDLFSVYIDKTIINTEDFDEHIFEGFDLDVFYESLSDLISNNF